MENDDFVVLTYGKWMKIVILPLENGDVQCEIIAINGHHKRHKHTAACYYLCHVHS